MKVLFITTMLIFFIMVGVCHSGEGITADKQPTKNYGINRFLAHMPPEDKTGSTIKFVIPDGNDPIAADLVHQIEAEWNSGQYEAAARIAEGLEKIPSVPPLEMQFSWDNPVSLTPTDTKSECTRVGGDDSARVAEFDVQRSTGNMIAVLVRDGDNTTSHVSIYYWSEDLQYWNRKLQMSGPTYYRDADCAIYGDYCVIAYTSDNSIKAVRFRMSDGAWVPFPSGETTIQFLTATTDIKELVVISAQDINTPHDYVYFIATLEYGGGTHVLRAHEDGETWYWHNPPGISNAYEGLDFCLSENNGDYAWPYSKFISLYDSNNYLEIYGYYTNTGSWHSLWGIYLGHVDRQFTSIDAYNNNIHCIFENDPGTAYTRLYSSFDGGSIWNEYMFEFSGYEHHCPDLTARAGSGLGLAYRIHYQAGQYYIITSRFQKGDYDFNPWYPYEIAMATAGPNVQPDLEFLPSGYYGYLGIKWSGSTPGHAYFCTMGYCCETAGDANNDGGCNIGDAVYLANYVFRASECAANYPVGCPPVCTPQGDANADGNINIGDAVFLNNYVFRPATSPVPACPSILSCFFNHKGFTAR